MEFVIQPLELGGDLFQDLPGFGCNTDCVINHVTICGCTHNDVQGCACPQK